MKYADSKHLEFSEHQHELHYPDPSQTGFSMPTNNTAGSFNVFSLSVTSPVQSLPSTPDALSAQIPKPTTDQTSAAAHTSSVSSVKVNLFPLCYDTHNTSKKTTNTM